MRDLQFLRLHDLDAGAVNKSIRPLFVDLLGTYVAFLEEKQAYRLFLERRTYRP